MTSIPFQDERGDWLVAGVNVDVSELKRAQMEARRHQEELLYVSRLSTLVRWPRAGPRVEPAPIGHSELRQRLACIDRVAGYGSRALDEKPRSGDLAVETSRRDHQASASVCPSVDRSAAVRST